VRTEFIWWFDDDSFVTGRNVLERWVRIADESPPTVVMWGQLAFCQAPSQFSPSDDVVRWVREAEWYRGLPPPSWRPGGKGEFDFEGRGSGDGRWFFAVGGCWMIRTSAIRELCWPDPRLVIAGEDALLGEAIRQQGWEVRNIGALGVRINNAARRGESA
jgi:GT2 family glycosyltransferase